MKLDRQFIAAVVDFGSGTGPTFVCGRVEDGGRWGDSHWIRVRTLDGPTPVHPIQCYSDFVGTILVGREDVARRALVAFYRANPDTLRERRNLLTRPD